MRGASERRWSVGQGSAAPCRRSRRRKRRSRAGIFLLRSFPLTPRPSGPRLQTDTLCCSPHAQTAGKCVTSLLELCQSHTACSSIILTVGGSVHAATAAAAGRHAAAAAGELLQLAGKRNDFLSVLPHHLLFEFKNELPRSSPAALSLKDALLVEQHPLQGLRRRRLLGAAVLGHLLHQDVVARVGVGQDAAGILGLGQSLLDDVLGRAVAQRLDDSVRLLWGNFVDLDEEHVVL